MRSKLLFGLICVLACLLLFGIFQKFIWDFGGPESADQSDNKNLVHHNEGGNLPLIDPGQNRPPMKNSESENPTLLELASNPGLFEKYQKQWKSKYKDFKFDSLDNLDTDTLLRMVALQTPRHFLSEVSYILAKKRDLDYNDKAIKLLRLNIESFGAWVDASIYQKDPSAFDMPKDLVLFSSYLTTYIGYDKMMGQSISDAKYKEWINYAETLAEKGEDSTAGDIYHSLYNISLKKHGIEDIIKVYELLPKSLAKRYAASTISGYYRKIGETVKSEEWDTLSIKANSRQSSRN